MSWAGTATTTRGHSTSTTSSRASDASICRRPFTRRSKATASWSARSARGLTTSIRTAVPAPYNHSNVMSDEVLYYANSEFMSRKGIEYGSVTLHPDGIPHGPHPGRAEDSIGKTHTDELAVMVDTFRPLHGQQTGARCRGQGILSFVAGPLKSWVQFRKRARLRLSARKPAVLPLQRWQARRSRSAIRSPGDRRSYDRSASHRACYTKIRPSGRQLHRIV